MKTYVALAAIGLGLMGSMNVASAQYGSDYEYRDRGDRYRDRDDDYRDRGRRDRGDDYGDRGGRGRDYGFDEREYLRCNPDVRRAIASGQMQSGAAHYKVFGRREGRRLSC